MVDVPPVQRELYQKTRETLRLLVEAAAPLVGSVVELELGLVLYSWFLAFLSVANYL